MLCHELAIPLLLLAFCDLFVQEALILIVTPFHLLSFLLVHYFSLLNLLSNYMGVRFVLKSLKTFLLFFLLHLFLQGLIVVLSDIHLLLSFKVFLF